MSAISRGSQRGFTRTMHTGSVIVLTTVSSAADLARPLLAGADAVLAVDPCPDHAALAELALAAAKCLSHRDYARLAGGAPLHDRLRWLLSADAAARFPSSCLGPLGPLEFAALKERATRIAVSREPLDRYLASLPDGVIDRAVVHDPVPLAVRQALARVTRRTRVLSATA